MVLSLSQILAPKGGCQVGVVGAENWGSTMDNQERQCWNDAVKDCMTAVEKLKKPNGNSKHGYCCTCTTCKNYHDECVCDYNTMIQEVLDTLKKELK